jgi:V8-like Glu-specific endopeptidase
MFGTLLKFLLVLTTFAFLLFEARAQPIELSPQPEGVAEPVDVSTPIFQPIEADGVAYWQHEFDDWTGSRFLRMHIAEVDLPEGFRGKLVLSTRSGRIIETYEGAKLANAADTWSKVVPGDYALVTLISEAPPVGFSLKIDAVARSTSEGVALSIIGRSELQDIADYARDLAVSTLSRPIAKLSFVKNGRQFTCSGFMYGKNLLMTNEHCVNSTQLCRSTVAIFHYQLENGQMDSGDQYRCTEFIAANRDLDYALLKLEGSPGEQWGTLPLSHDGVKANEPLMIIQHPGGRPKMISLINCTSKEPIADGIKSASDFTHECDTEHGSSGSPVLTLNGRVIGLHHFGVAEGQFWNQNRAVRMSLIMDDMPQH